MSENADKALRQLVAEGGARVLLHACCAPCASHCLEVLLPLSPVVFYYNPCIMPRAEYDKRGAELARLCDIFGAELVFGEYDNALYLAKVRGSEGAQEGGERCKICFSDRLIASAGFADKNGFDYFCTTLTVSPHKNSDIINQIGFDVAQKQHRANALKKESHPTPQAVQEVAKNISALGLSTQTGQVAAQKTQYLPSDFKKAGGYQRSIELSKQYNLYRQSYCGCRLG